jgi:general stress protein YciG
MPEKGRRGFAAMDPERRRELASRGGRNAHARGTAHIWNERAAREAGRKGGRAVGADREYMSLIGREGGRMRRLAAEAARAEALAHAKALLFSPDQPGPEALTSSLDIGGPHLEQPGMT